jgi:hypothetical protein
MNLITNFSTDPLQVQTINLPNGNVITLTLCFKPMQFGWFIQELDYLGFTLNGKRLCLGANILYQWQNLLPFGIGVYSSSNREPSLQQDLTDPAGVSIYLLTQAECQAYQEFLSGI